VAWGMIVPTSEACHVTPPHPVCGSSHVHGCCRPCRVPARQPVSAVARRAWTDIHEPAVRGLVPQPRAASRGAMAARAGCLDAVCREPVRPAGRGCGPKPDRLEVPAWAGVGRPWLRWLGSERVPRPARGGRGGNAAARHAFDVVPGAEAAGAARTAAHGQCARARGCPRPQPALRRLRCRLLRSRIAKRRWLRYRDDAGNAERSGRCRPRLAPPARRPGLDGLLRQAGRRRPHPAWRGGAAGLRRGDRA